jgi:hypothetical protein
MTNAQDIGLLQDQAVALFRSLTGSDELCLAVSDALYATVIFSLGAGLGLRVTQGREPQLAIRLAVAQLKDAAIRDGVSDDVGAAIAQLVLITHD